MCVCAHACVCVFVCARVCVSQPFWWIHHAVSGTHQPDKNESRPTMMFVDPVLATDASNYNAPV